MENRGFFIWPSCRLKNKNRRLVYGALLTGCRYGELARMKVRDFDAISGTVLIQENKAGKPRRALLTTEGRAFFEGITAGRGPHDMAFSHLNTSAGYSTSRKVHALELMNIKNMNIDPCAGVPRGMAQH